MAKFIRVKALLIKEDRSTSFVDYNANIDHIVAFGDPEPSTKEKLLPEDFKGSVIAFIDGANTIVGETPRKIRSLIAEVNIGPSLED